MLSLPIDAVAPDLATRFFASPEASLVTRNPTPGLGMRKAGTIADCGLADFC